MGDRALGVLKSHSRLFAPFIITIPLDPADTSLLTDILAKIAAVMSTFFEKLKRAVLMQNKATPAPTDDWKTGTFVGSKYHYLHIKASEPTKATFLLLHGFPNGKLPDPA